MEFDLRSDGSEQAAPAFAVRRPELLQRNLLEFVYEPVTHHRWFGERTCHLALEQRILDGAGNQLGRVTQGRASQRPREYEWNLSASPTVESPPSPGDEFSGSVYDDDDRKVIEFMVGDGWRRRRFLGAFEWCGRRVEVVDGTGHYVGTFIDEGGREGMLLGGSSQRIGAMRDNRFWPGETNYAIKDLNGEVGWLASPAGHARRLAAQGFRARPGLLEMLTFPEPRHFLVITGNVSDNLRLMVLAVAASITVIELEASDGGESG